MIVTGSSLAQWGAIALGFIYFLWRQAKGYGALVSQIKSIENEIIEFKSNTNDRMDNNDEHIIMVESRFNATGDDRIMLWGQHDRIQGECQRRLLEKIQMNAEVFERVANRMDKMDDRRESTREKDDERLRAIENSIATMTESLKHLATVIDRREPIITEKI